MNSTVNIPLTKVYVNNKYLGLEDGITPGYFYGITSIPGRQFLCHVMLEDGSNWYGLPLNALNTKNSTNIEEDLILSQAYDCFSYSIDVIRFDFLRDQQASIQGNLGRYMFTIISLDPNGRAPFSEFPEQAKTFVFIELNDGRIVTGPNNYIRWLDKSLYDFTIETPKYKRIDKIYRSDK